MFVCKYIDAERLLSRFIADIQKDRKENSIRAIKTRSFAVVIHVFLSS